MDEKSNDEESRNGDEELFVRSNQWWDRKVAEAKQSEPRVETVTGIPGNQTLAFTLQLRFNARLR